MDEDISYENKLNLAFDKPLEYRNILLYPATLDYYSLFSIADECLDVNRLEERDVRLLRLPYLDYMYEKSLVDAQAQAKWSMLIYILKIVFGEDQPFEVIRENGRVEIKVHQRSDKYELLNKEYTILRTNFFAAHKEKKATAQETIDIAKKLSDLQDQMYNVITIGSEDFDKIRKLIMIQNDIKSEHYDAKTEALLDKMREKLKQTRADNNDVDFEDLITIVSYMMHIKQSDLENMTIRRFNRYLDIALKKDDYYMYKSLEVSGEVKFKSEIKHWVSHYEPKGKYDGLLIKGNDLMSSLNDGGKI